MKYLFLSVLTLAVFLSAASAGNPGLKLIATSKAINDFSANFLPSIVSQLGTVKIADTNVVGFKLTNIVIQNLRISDQNINVTLEEGKGIFATQSFGLELKYYLEGKVLGLIPIHFNGGGSSSNSKLRLEFSFGRKGDSTQIFIDKLQINVRNLQLQFPKDGLGDAITEISKSITGPLEETISTLISNALKGVIQKALNDALNKIPPNIHIPHTPLSTNIQGTQAPSINTNYMIGFVNGTLFNTKDGFSMPPIDPPASTSDFDFSSAVQALVTEYTFNSGLYALWKSGMMEMNVTKSILPERDQGGFNVRALKQLFPEVTKYFANENSEIIVNIKLAKAPVAKIYPNIVAIEGDITLTCYVVSDGQKASKIATIQSKLNLQANASIKEWIFEPQILEGSFRDFSVLSSNIGSFDATKAQTEANKLVESAISEFNAAKLKIPLPKIEGLDLSSLYIVIQDGYIRVEADPKYTTTDMRILFPADLF